MISRLYRFHGHSALSYVYRKGRTVRTPQCTLKFVPNDRRPTYRVAVVVSKKLSKSAVVRNRIRRRLYEEVRGRLPDDARYDLVFTAFDLELGTMPKKQLETTISKLLQISGLETTGGQGTCG